MYTVSENYETVINGYSRHFQARLLKNGEIVNAEIKKHSVRKYSSTGEDISIGCAFASSAEISCIAASSLSSLKDSEITLETGLEITSGEYEYVPDGVYTITSQKTKGEITTLIGYDKMYVSGSKTFSWPIIPVLYSDLVSELASQLGVPFDLDCLEAAEDFTIEDFIDSGGYTLQEMAGYLAGLIGKNAYINRAGQLTFRAYVDSGYAFDGNRISDIDVDQTARQINWLQCTVGDETLQSGTGSGYAKMANPLMTEKFLDNAAGKIPISYYGAEAAFLLGDPRLDPWDMIWYKVKMVKDILVDEDGATLVDEFGNVFADWGDGLIPILCHEITYSFDGGLSMDVTSYALSETEENTNFRGPTQQAVEKAQQVAGEAKEAAEKAKKEVSRYADVVNNMSQLAMNSLGFYQTTETLSDGSQIVYMHDKPALEDSQTIYKRTIDGFFISQDGGNTYTSGFDSNGNAVLNVLSVIGINFDWAYGGTLTLGGSDNTNGVLNIVDADGDPIVIGNKDGLTIYKGSIKFSDITDENGNTLESHVTDITKTTIKTSKITADQITSGIIKSQNYEYDSGNFSTAGTCLDLSNGILRSVNFLLGSNGESYFSGNIISESGQIGGFNITSDSLYNGCTSLDSTENGVYIGTMGIRTFGDDGSITIRDYLLEAKTDNDARSVAMTGTGINIFACTDEESLYTNGISFYLDDKINAFIDENGCFSTQTAPDYSYYGFYWESGDAFLNELKLNDALYMGYWSDSEKNIYFTNLGDGKYQHHCKLYGGNGASRTGIGFYDSLYSRGVWVYDDVNNLIISDATLQYVDVTVTVNSTNATEVAYSAKAFPFLRMVVFHAHFTVNEITRGVTTELGTISSSYAPVTCLAALSTWVNSSLGTVNCASHITTSGSICFHFRDETDSSVNLASGRYVYVSGVWTY